MAGVLSGKRGDGHGKLLRFNVLNLKDLGFVGNDVTSKDSGRLGRVIVFLLCEIFDGRVI